MKSIAEKHGFIKARSVTVCVKVGIGRKVGHKEVCVLAYF